MDDVEEDVLRGVVTIAAFRGEKPHRTQYLIEQKQIPVGKEGTRYIASKRRLIEHHLKSTSGEAA